MSLTIFGPIAIHVYGVCIALGVIVALILAYRQRWWERYVSQDMLIMLINLAVIAGIIGGRALSVITDYDQIDSWVDILAFWDGGFSVLGSIIAITLTIGIYATIKKLSLLAILDFFGLYAPLVQAFGRIGCYFAGCCHGSPTNLPWGITYTDPLSLAPLCIRLHPTQLYNTFALLLLFSLLTLFMRKQPRHGSIFAFSLVGLSLIRLITDFLRGDRGMLFPCGQIELSTNQIISLFIIVFAITILVVRHIRTKK